MDKKFLNKVLNHIVRETRIDHDKKEIYFPFYSSPFFYFPHFPISHFHFLFHFLTNHCRDVYGLNEEEIDYVWKEYKKIITDKIDG